MTTRDLFKVLKELAAPNVSFVCSLGRTSEEAYKTFPSQTLFLDSLGDVLPLAIGVALGVPSHHPVVALDTDGSHLFGLSTLPTLGALQKKLSNLSVIVLDNGLYESAGNVPSRLCTISWKSLASAFDLTLSIVTTIEDFRLSFRSPSNELTYLIVNIENEDESPPAAKPIDGIESKYLFERHLEAFAERPPRRPAIKS